MITEVTTLSKIAPATEDVFAGSEHWDGVPETWEEHAKGDPGEHAANEFFQRTRGENARKSRPDPFEAEDRMYRIFLKTNRYS